MFPEPVQSAGAGRVCAPITIAGRTVDVFSLEDADFRIAELAHSLALINRFNGHTPEPISVAQHSVCVARLVAPQHQKQALLHDAAEALVGDVTKWLKSSPMFSGYRQLEHLLQRQIFVRFGCAPDLAPEIEEADRVMVRFEGQTAFGPQWEVHGPDGPHPDYPPLTHDEYARVRRQIGAGWSPWPWKVAELSFMALWEEIARKEAA